MKKFKIVKKFSLDFVGAEWKEAYINFTALTIGDIKDKFPALATLEETNPADVVGGIDEILGLLKEKFISGKGVIEAPEETGKLVDLVADDLEALPIDVLSKALTFLSQGAVEVSPKQ